MVAETDLEHRVWVQTRSPDNLLNRAACLSRCLVLVALMPTAPQTASDVVAVQVAKACVWYF